MSEKEHDQTTEEMFDVVNSHASDESKRQAEKVIQDLKAAANAKAQAEREREKAEQEREKAEIRRKDRTKGICGLILRMLICTLAAALFVGALLLPSWVPVLCFAGLAVCLIVGAIVTDRFIRSWR